MANLKSIIASALLAGTVAGTAQATNTPHLTSVNSLLLAPKPEVQLNGPGRVTLEGEINRKIVLDSEGIDYTKLQFGDRNKNISPTDISLPDGYDIQFHLNGEKQDVGQFNTGEANKAVYTSFPFKIEVGEGGSVRVFDPQNGIEHMLEPGTYNTERLFPNFAKGINVLYFQGHPDPGMMTQESTTLGGVTVIDPEGRSLEGLQALYGGDSIRDDVEINFTEDYAVIGSVKGDCRVNITDISDPYNPIVRTMGPGTIITDYQNLTTTMGLPDSNKIITFEVRPGYGSELKNASFPNGDKIIAGKPYVIENTNMDPHFECGPQ